MASDVWEAGKVQQHSSQHQLQQWQLEQLESQTRLQPQPSLQRQNSAAKHHMAFWHCMPQQHKQQWQQQQHQAWKTSSAAVVLLCLLVFAGTHHLANQYSSGRRNLAAGPIAPEALKADSSGASGTSTSTSTSASARDMPQGLSCPFGSSPGTWVTSGEAGSRWQLLDPDCKLTNWLSVYAEAGRSSSSSETGSSSSSSSETGSSSSSSNVLPSSAAGSAAAAEVELSSHDPAVLAADSSASEAAASGSGDGSSSSSSSSITGAAGQHLPEARILLLSDSVDRYIVQHVCSHIGGTKHTLTMKHWPGHDASAPATAAAAEPAAPGSVATPEAAEAAAAAAGSGRAAPSSLNKTAYAFHTCESGLPLKLASSYFPGVHPSGPFHRGLAQDYRQRIDAAQAMWYRYAGPGNAPHMVSVAALLWDIARLYMHERDRIEGRHELELDVLQSWMRNFTDVVHYAQQAFPETKLWVTHTTMPPRYNAASGLATKPYLGRRYFIDQLNAAAAAVARRLPLQLIDYAALSQRFMAGQEYLYDLIHPNEVVGVEVFNIMLNMVLQQEEQQQQEQEQEEQPL